jgi:Tfp pilus assembly protein PilN
MIEVNLLPGAKKKAKRGGGAPAINFAAIGAAIAAKVKDVWLGAAIASGVVALLVIGYLFMSQRRQESQLNAAVTKAAEDSARYAAVFRDRNRAQARRDSALLQLKIIKAIDEDRYIWPHVMEEVSRALPIYTWLTVMNVTGTPQGTNPPAAIKAPRPDTSVGPRKKTVEPVIPRDTVRFRLVGRTVDIQALTRFMRSLEESPFLGSVGLEKSEIVAESGKDITQFTLRLTFTRPDTLLLRRTPLTLTQR